MTHHEHVCMDLLFCLFQFVLVHADCRLQQLQDFSRRTPAPIVLCWTTTACRHTHTQTVYIMKLSQLFPAGMCGVFTCAFVLLECFSDLFHTVHKHLFCIRLPLSRLNTEEEIKGTVHSNYKNIFLIYPLCVCVCVLPAPAASVCWRAVSVPPAAVLRGQRSPSSPSPRQHFVHIYTAHTLTANYKHMHTYTEINSKNKKHDGDSQTFKNKQFCNSEVKKKNPHTSECTVHICINFTNGN